MIAFTLAYISFAVGSSFRHRGYLLRFLSAHTITTSTAESQVQFPVTRIFVSHTAGPAIREISRVKRQSVCRSETPGNLHCGRVCTLRLWKCQGRQQHFFSAVFAARAPAMGTARTECGSSHSSWKGSLLLSTPATAACLTSKQTAVLSALLVIQLFGIVVSPPHISPKEHQKERCGHYSAAALLHYFSWCASDYFVVSRISCHVSHDNTRTNVCQWPFAKNFLLLLFLNRFDQ